MRFNFVHKSSRLETELSQISVELLAVVPKKEQIEIKITFTVYAEKITLKILIAVTTGASCKCSGANHSIF